METRRFRREVLTATGAAAMLMLSQAAHASTIVATIIGDYNATCGSCGIVSNGGGAGSGTGGPNITHYANNGGGGADTPSLFILNPTSKSFTNVTLTLTGYQDAAGGNTTAATFTASAPNPVKQTISGITVAPNTVLQLAWNGQGGAASGGGATFGAMNLSAADYDDILGERVPFGSGQPRFGTAPTGTVFDSSGGQCNQVGSAAQSGICAFVGNFSVDFEADWTLSPSGKISSVFSNLAVGTNAFVGWEGLDGDGLSETIDDNHASQFPGTLANILTGTHQGGGGTGASTVPEPSSLALLGAGLGALAMARRRRKTPPSAA